MFKFKKSMAGTAEQNNFECECCGSMEKQSSGSCCGPVGNNTNGTQMPGCVPCGTPTQNPSCCDQTKNSCCG